MSDPKPVEQTPAVEPEKVEAVPATDKPVETPAATEPEVTGKDMDIAPRAEELAQDAPVKVAEPNDAPAATIPEPEAAKPEERQPEKPAYLTKIPSLSEFFEHLPTILSSAGHDEMWGVSLKGSEDIPTVNVLIKFLRANEGNLQAAEDQLRKALQWRKEVNPLALAESGRYSASKYGGLGYLTIYEDEGRPLVFTWNIYGAVKDITSTFSDSDEFVRWRAALMELAVQDLKMKDATTAIEYDGENDPYRMIQVHDYLNVKFFRMDPAVRTATKKTIDVFSTAYPELLREKFFVNVPSIMGWMFSAMKLILSRNTTRKFHPISNGVNLAREFSTSVADKMPKVYGGNGQDLKEGARTVQLTEDEPKKEEEKKEEEKKKEEKTAEPSGENTTPETSRVAEGEKPAQQGDAKESGQDELIKDEATAEESKQADKVTEASSETK